MKTGPKFWLPSSYFLIFWPSPNGICVLKKTEFPLIRTNHGWIFNVFNDGSAEQLCKHWIRKYSCFCALLIVSSNFMLIATRNYTFSYEKLVHEKSTGFDKKLYASIRDMNLPVILKSSLFWRELHRFSTEIFWFCSLVSLGYELCFLICFLCFGFISYGVLGDPKEMNRENSVHRIK